MTQSLLEHNPEAQQEHFNTFGHVYVSDAYDAAIAPAVIEELVKFFEWTTPMTTVLGEQKTIVETAGNYDHYPHIQAMLTDIGKASLNLTKCELWPVPKPDKLRLVRIDMQRGAQGERHIDDTRLVVGTGVITTLSGTSELIVENEDNTPIRYDIAPGGAVLLDSKRKLYHQARATGSDTRIGLGITRSPH